MRRRGRRWRRSSAFAQTNTFEHACFHAAFRELRILERASSVGTKCWSLTLSDLHLLATLHRHRLASLNAAAPACFACRGCRTLSQSLPQERQLRKAAKSLSSARQQPLCPPVHPASALAPHLPAPNPTLHTLVLLDVTPCSVLRTESSSTLAASTPNLDSVENLGPVLSFPQSSFPNLRPRF